MARLRLTLHDISCFQEQTLEAITRDLAVSTESETEIVYFQSGDEKYSYKLTLVDFSFKKQMYQPTEVIADIQISMTAGDSVDFEFIGKDELVALFKGKKSSLELMPDLASNQKDPLFTIGNDYYVQDVQPRYKKAGLYMTLKINSLDKLMTLQYGCHNFVAQKLVKDILDSQIKLYTNPWGTTGISYADKMKHLYFEREEGSDKKKYEHTFPYLVQYNESFYDFMTRTTNRWGEFMYYENGKLNIGYDDSDDAKADIGDYNTISYIDLANTVEIPKSGKYDCEAADEKGLLDCTLRKTPNKVKGTLFSPGGDGDKVAMKKISGFFKNDKNLPTFIVGQLVDDTFDYARKKISVNDENSEFDKKYFSDQSKFPERYGEHNFGDDDDPDNGDGFNMFSEIDSEYGESKYRDILTKEKLAAKNAILIDYDVTCPKLKLGNIITFNDEKYIVVEISSRIDEHYEYGIENLVNVVKTLVRALVFEVKAIRMNSSDSKFYPTVIPAGHVRYADPQIATVDDDKDPDGSGRVRVKFGWHGEKDDATPWIKFTANAGGQKGIMGKHYKKDKVFVGYVDGNVERPYVMGALSKGAGSDIQCVTPGGRVFKMEDDSAGLQKFLTGMFLPMWGTLSGFIPGMDDLNPYKDSDNNLAMAGGFEISDRYGIYKISGSTDDRVVNIASPWGDVSINAFTGITISAPNGDVTIKGKNVSIEAGNNLSLVSGKNVNYKLWKEKKTAGGEIAQILLDIPVIVAKKLAEMALNIVDLSIVRSVVDIVMRPVEGSLTVKSNRFLKLEAGKNNCDIPAAGYSDFKSRYEGFKNKLSNQYSAGLLIPDIEMGTSMKEIFEKIDPMVKTLDQRYKTIYNNCVKLKGQLKADLEELDKWVEEDGKKAYDAADFDTLYTNLKADLWKAGKYEPFKEEKLIKVDQLPIDGGEPEDVVSDACWNRHKAEFRLLTTTVEEDCVGIINIRKTRRKSALKNLNDLRKEICKLLNLEFDASDIGKQLSWFLGSPAPKDFKKKMNTAFSRGKCKESRYYKFADDDARKGLGADITTNTGLSDDDLSYMKRVVAMNLLDQFGFTDDLRKKVNGVLPPKPDPDLTKPNSIMAANVWSNYVKSLSGIPKLGRDVSQIAGAIEGAAKDAYDKIAVWDNFIERFSWGEGKSGQILFGADGETYALKNKAFDDVTPLNPNINCLRDDDATLDAQDKTLVEAFVGKVRDAIKNY